MFSLHVYISTASQNNLKSQYARCSEEYSWGTHGSLQKPFDKDYLLSTPPELFIQIAAALYGLGKWL